MSDDYFLEPIGMLDYICPDEWGPHAPGTRRRAMPKKSDSPRQFWLVCRDPSTVSHHEPVHAIFSASAARARAAALSKETGHRFYVLAAVASCEPTAPPVAWSEL